MSKFFTHLILSFHSIIYCFQPKKKLRENLLFACEEAEVKLVFKLLEKGANFYYYKKNVCSDPACLLKIFICNPLNRAYIPELLDKIGGITPDLLTTQEVYRMPLLEWTIRYFLCVDTDSQAAIEAFAEKTVSLEAINIMAHQAQCLIRDNTDLPLAQLALEKMQARKKILEVLEEQRSLNDTIPLRAEAIAVKPSKFKV